MIEALKQAHYGVGMLRPARVQHGDCPYLPDREWIADIVPASYFTAGEYESMLEQGVRRSGHHLYRNACPGCDLCIPIRIPTAHFRPGRTQRRVLRRNADLEVESGPISDDAEVFALYQRYNRERHGHREPISPTAYRTFLGEGPYPGALIRYRLDRRLIGAGWLDVLPGGVSSVYFAFDPDYSDRRLGTFSVMQEIAWARELGKRWYYLGFWVPEGKGMAYKADFKPHEIALHGRWRAAGGWSALR